MLQNVSSQFALSQSGSGCLSRWQSNIYRDFVKEAYEFTQLMQHNFVEVILPLFN